MSLDRTEQTQTRDELQVNLTLAGVSAGDVADALGWDGNRTTGALEVAGADPRDVWLVRDFLERAFVATGKTPQPYSTLTEQARGAAEAWFGLYDLDAATNGVDR